MFKIKEIYSRLQHLRLYSVCLFGFPLDLAASGLNFTQLIIRTTIGFVPILLQRRQSRRGESELS